MPNRLAHETSPYLLQHAHNPVDWYPWGAEALERARREDKPILLSIGYAACHWCHVMERESFEDETTAQLMNDRFVPIKVDREERPDLDGIYMQAVQAMTGHGGWPMTVFLTPEGVPFYGGTYFPPEDRHGIPSFRRILTTVSDAYRTKRDAVAQTTDSVRQLYATAAEQARSHGPLSRELLERAVGVLARQYDAEHGGFGGAPKFPATMALEFLLTQATRTNDARTQAMVVDSFRHMARGGIYDQVGGGFARYAVDAIWLVPHFEKMLYDNALLLRLAVHLWQRTGDAEPRRIAEETLGWLAREMREPDGGFLASLDADSEGHEGKFYVWTDDELREALLAAGADEKQLEMMRFYWGVTAEGNFEGTNILHVAHDPSEVAHRFGITEAHLAERVLHYSRALLAWRARRVRPARDEKRIASWNGLAVRAVAEAARAFGRVEDRVLAIEGADFLWTRLVTDAGEGPRVLRSYAAGRATLPGYLEDHAAVALAMLAVYELTFDRQWLDRARALADSMVRAFWSDEVGAFYDTASDHEALVARPREPTDNATPSGTSLAAELLARLGDLLHDVDMTRRATWVVETLAEPMVRYPTAFGHLLGVADLVINGATELAIVGAPADPRFQALADAAAHRFIPALIVAGGPPGEASGIALLEDRPMVDGKPAAYLCRNYACEAPVTSAAELHAVRV